MIQLKKPSYSFISKIGVSKINDLWLCPLKVILQTTDSSSISQPSPPAVLGTVIHKVFELESMINTESEFDQIWNSTLSKILNKLSESENSKYFKPFSWKCRHYWPKRAIVKKIVLERKSPEKDGVRGNRIIRKEKKIRGKYFRGEIDFYEIQNNTLFIKDYKTGNLFERGGYDDLTLKKSYVQQLKLYAGIVLSKRKDIKFLKLSLVGVNGKEYAIKTSVDECINFLETSNSKIDEINKIIESKEISTLPVQNDKCVFCNVRFFCPYYSEFLISGINGTNQFDLVGKLLSIFNTNKGYEMILETSNGIKKVSRIPKIICSLNEFHNFINYKIVLFNLYKTKNIDDMYYGTLKTKMFQI